MSQSKRLCVLGAGSWGTALAILLARNGHQTSLWGHNPSAMERLHQDRCNQRYLPDISFPEQLQVEADLNKALAAVDLVLVAVPSSGFRQVLQRIKPLLPENAGLVWATKGLEHGTRKLLSEVCDEELDPSVVTAVISGPTFAMEVAKGLPTALTVASADSEFALDLAETFHNDTFRVYTSSDMVGLQIGGAVKNVLAIAAGVSDGLGFGANARSALITRGLAEMSRLGLGLGGHMETFMGLAGLGDLVLTCTDNQSRNRRLGLALGQGLSRAVALEQINQVVEGIQTAEEIYTLASINGVEMPIVEQVYAVLFQDKSPQNAVKSLLLRHIKAES